MTPVTRPRSLLAGAIAAAGLVAGGVVAVPAAADPSSDPFSGLVGPLVGQPSDGGERIRHDDGRHGHTHADDGILRRGCHNYRYRYVVKVPTHDWTLETFLDDRTGQTVASNAFSADADPKRGHGVFRFCRYSTYAGRFKIRAKLNWYTDSGHHQVWLKPSFFRLRRH